MTDRGVNIKCKDDEKITGMDICKEGKIFPFPKFTPTIFKLKLEGDKAKIVDVIPLKDSKGNPITGISNPLSNFPETAYYINGTEIKKDPDGLDTESLAVMKNGSFWIGEEYAPSLVHVSKDGRILERLVPKGLEKELANATYPVKGVLPAIIAKRHPNRGIEAIAISPDEKYLYFSIQSPLDNPDYSKTKNVRDVRMYKMSLGNYTNIKEFLYKEDKASTFTQDDPKEQKQHKVKISEMTCLKNGTIIVLERLAKTTKLYKVDFANATPVPPDKSANLETNDTGVIPLSKTLIFNTANHMEEDFPSKIEGMAPLGDGKLLLINDNDFGIKGDHTVMKIHINE
ncbi:MAG: esterase-like activity of phytase family protein [Nitrospiraceae bacterium]|nr:esterase-like activity of phytase family protein [Nitrospiraceae bacterium]